MLRNTRFALGHEMGGADWEGIKREGVGHDRESTIMGAALTVRARPARCVCLSARREARPATAGGWNSGALSSQCLRHVQANSVFCQKPPSAARHALFSPPSSAGGLKARHRRPAQGPGCRDERRGVPAAGPPAVLPVLSWVGPLLRPDCPENHCHR